ncbi:MAG: hypothetical protein HY675_26745 [Chloroflexi bacterium]|nr:hypothetical protein [Chloroflexota bacterium]
MIAREIEKEGIPAVLITAMTMLGKQIGANRIVAGTKLIHPCGDPSLPAENDHLLRQKIVECAQNAFRTAVTGPTVFVPDVTYAFG